MYYDQRKNSIIIQFSYNNHSTVIQPKVNTRKTKKPIPPPIPCYTFTWIIISINSIQEKKNISFVSPRVPSNLRFPPPRNSRAATGNVPTNVIVDRPIKSLVRPRDLHYCGQATRKRRVRQPGA